MSFLLTLLGAIPGVTRTGTDDADEIIRPFGGITNGLDGNDTLIGGFGSDSVFGGPGGDLIRARTGNDLLSGDEGNDNLRAGRGDDTLIGGSDDDEKMGGFGADKFVFDPSNPDEGNDKIMDLNLDDGDRIVLNAADIFRASPGLTDPFANLGSLDGSDFDADPGWNISGSNDGNVVVEHPGGTIEIVGLAFSEDLTFAALLPAIEIANVQTGNDRGNFQFGTHDSDFVDGRGGNDRQFGRDGNDLLLGGDGNDRQWGGDGNDLIAGGSGNDVKRGGDGADFFRFDPSNEDEGIDRIIDFNPGEGDKIQLSAADVLATLDPAILPEDFELTDLDAAPNWSLFAVPGGDATVLHPGGAIVLAGLGSALSGVTSFDDLGPNGLDVLDLIA